MILRIDHPADSMDWQRIAALGSSFAAHLAAVALIASPLQVPLRRERPPIIEATLTVPEPRPADAPAPPEPAPPAHTHPEHHPIAPVPTAPAALVPAPVTAAPAPVPATAAPTGNEGPGPLAPSGENRVLAYAGALALRYPPASVRSREQGTVVLRVLVDARGSAQRIELVRSSGHVRLDEAARDAVGRARFQPVLRNGEAIPAWGLVPVAFRLDRA